MVTPQGDLRAGADRAPSLTLSFMAGAMLTFPLFAEKLSVLLPALCLTLTALLPSQADETDLPEF